MKISNRRKYLIAIAVIVLLAVGIGLWFFLGREPDRHKEVAKAIEYTEGLDTFLVQIYSAGTLTSGNVTQKTQTAGYLYSESDQSMVSVYVNTKSSTSNAPEEDFDVTAAMYCDGKQVYDNTDGRSEPMDMSCEEFMRIVSQYGLYSYDRAMSTDIAYEENTLEGMNGGQYSVTLTAPADPVLEAYAGILSQTTSEEVRKEDLKILSAYAVYSIYDEKVVTQTCSFTVEYTTKTGKVVRYETVNQVTYLDDFENVEEYIPVT